MLYIFVSYWTSWIYQASWIKWTTFYYKCIESPSSLLFFLPMPFPPFFPCPLFSFLIRRLQIRKGKRKKPINICFLSTGTLDYTIRNWSYHKKAGSLKSSLSKLSQGFSSEWNMEYFRFFQTAQHYFSKKRGFGIFLHAFFQEFLPSELWVYERKFNFFPFLSWELTKNF